MHRMVGLGGRTATKLLAIAVALAGCTVQPGFGGMSYGGYTPGVAVGGYGGGDYGMMPGFGWGGDEGWGGGDEGWGGGEDD